MGPFYLFWIVIFLLRVGNVSCLNLTLSMYPQGCAFDIPYELTVNPEPESTPLRLSIDIHIVGLTEVAKSGKSYGIDVEYVPLVHLIYHDCFS